MFYICCYRYVKLKILINMDEKVKENIERLGEIIAAMNMVKIGKKLKDELGTIHHLNI